MQAHNTPHDDWPAMQENDVLVVWVQSAYVPMRVTFVEGLPPSTPLRQNLGAINTGATIQATLITGVQIDDNQLLQLRFRPLDDVNLLLWHQRGQANFWVRNAAAQVSLHTGLYDPTWRSSTFWVYGKDKDPYIEARNTTDYNLGQCRVQMWGWRAITERLPWSINLVQRTIVGDGNQPLLASPFNGNPIRWIAAEGRQG